jgi:4a-hydroxytetrahydrobiopterin dehydratase
MNGLDVGAEMSKSDNQCDACRADAPQLVGSDLQQAISELPGWTLETIDDVPQLVRQYTFQNFAAALHFANTVGEIAEREGHHPALLVEWGSVCVRWWTHKIQGIHALDVKLAKETELLYEGEAR